MRRPSLLHIAPVVAGLALGGCATQNAARPHAAAFGGPAARPVDLPVARAPGPPREVRVLVDEQALKLAGIVLRDGTALPSHRSDVPVTIVALSGRGVVVVGAERLALDPAHAVALAAGVPHAVEPDAGGDLVLLVHHLGRGEEHAR